MAASPTAASAAWHEALLKLYQVNATPHCQNLLHQCTEKSAAHSKSFQALGQIIPAYLELATSLEGFDATSISESAVQACERFDAYMALLRLSSNDVFSSVSDLRTSAVPEFFLRIFNSLIKHHKAQKLEVSGQREIAVELSFDPRTENFVVARTQRVDAAIVLKAPMTVAGRELKDFCIPIFAAEAKTYFDKNMLSGVDQSAAGMKATFPHCLYFAISEFADFELSSHSYASGAIDEIFILRRQKRADFRQSLDASTIDAALVAEILNAVGDAIQNHDKKRPRLDVRMKLGKLIG